MEWPSQSSNTTGVFLEITEGRSLYFTPRESVIFGYLFDLADTDDDGLVGGADGGHAFLSRARLPPETLQQLWSEAGGGSPDACLARPQWFVLLALVALAQAGLPCTLRDLLNTCDSQSSAIAAPGSIPVPTVGRGAGQSQKQQQQQQQKHAFHSKSHAQSQQNQEMVHVQMQMQNHRLQPGGSQNHHQQQHCSQLSPLHQGTDRPRPIPDFFLSGGVPLPSMRKPKISLQTSSERGGAESRGQGGRNGGKGRKAGRGFVDGGGGHGQEMWGEWEDGGAGSQGREGEGGEGEDSDDQDDDYHLEITVYSHRVVGEGYGSHTEYTVLANASVPRFARRELEVARRYSDFRWLHGCFRAIPGVLPPPLPPSKWAGSSSRDFVAERMKGLQRYMTRVAKHPVLRRQYTLQVFLEGTPRGLRAAKALLPGAVSGLGSWGDTFSPLSKTVGANPASPALSSSSGTTPPDESVGFARRRFSLGGADDVYGGAGGVVVGVGGNARQGQRRSMSFGASSDDCSNGGGGGGGWTGGGGGGNTATPWPLSVVANVGYEAYGNYVATSLTSIKGVLGAVKTKARSVVGLAAGPAPVTVEPDPVYDAEVVHIDELVTPVSGSVKVMESAAVLKRGVGYEMSRLGHYLTQVASLEDADGVPSGVSIAAVGVEAGRSTGRSKRGGETKVTGILTNGGSGAGLAKAEQVLGQRMERVATAWLEAIDQEESEFLDPLREQLGYLGSAKEVHRGRLRALDGLQTANASLQKNKQRLHAARAQGDTHAAAVSTAKMEAAEERMAYAQTRAALIAKTFKGEAKRFHSCRQTEGIAAVLELARAQAAFARKANASWKQVLEDINPTDEELRQSQQRVQHPRREARIGDGGGWSGRGLGGWLGGTPAAGGAIRGGVGRSGKAGNKGGGREVSVRSPAGGNASVGSASARHSSVGNTASGDHLATENGYMEHGGPGIPGMFHGGSRALTPSSGRPVSLNDDVRGISCDAVASGERGLGMRLGLALGSGLASGSSGGEESKPSSLWGEEEAQASELQEVGAQINTRKSAPAASTFTSLQSNDDDWESLEQPLPEAALQAREEREALASADAADDEGSSTTEPPLSGATAAKTAATAWDTVAPPPRGIKSTSSSPHSSVASPSLLSASSHEQEPGVIDSAVALGEHAISSGSGSHITAAARKRASKREGKSNKMSVVASAGKSSVEATSEPTTGGGITSNSSVTAPATPSGVAAACSAPPARPATALSLMDSLEALSSSGDGEGLRARNAASTSRGDGKEEDKSGDDSDYAKSDMRTFSLEDLESSPNPGSTTGASASTETNGDSKTGSGIGSEASSGSVESGSGSGSGSGGFGTVSAPTTVVRLAGSPNPSVRRGVRGKQSGNPADGSGSRAHTGLRRVSADGGRRGRGKVMP